MLVGETCSSDPPLHCCGYSEKSNYWVCDNLTNICTECLANGSSWCITENDLCCKGLKCVKASDGSYNTCALNTNSAPPLFNMYFSLKQLVGFAVVIVATGVL